MYGFGGVGLSEVQISISELSVVGGGWWVVVGGWTGQTHFMVGPSQGPTKSNSQIKICFQVFITKTGDWEETFQPENLRLLCVVL